MDSQSQPQAVIDRMQRQFNLPANSWVVILSERDCKGCYNKLLQVFETNPIMPGIYCILASYSTDNPLKNRSESILLDSSSFYSRVLLQGVSGSKFIKISKGKLAQVIPISIENTDSIAGLIIHKVGILKESP